MRVLVCGDRNWQNREIIRRELEGLPVPKGPGPLQSTVIIHGACRGADSLADQIARELGLEVEAYPAEWHRYGRAAGPIRNRRMLEEGQPDLVLAFHTDLERSRGTRNMVEQARRRGIPIRVCSGTSLPKSLNET